MKPKLVPRSRFVDLGHSFSCICEFKRLPKYVIFSGNGFSCVDDVQQRKVQQRKVGKAEKNAFVRYL